MKSNGKSLILDKYYKLKLSIQLAKNDITQKDLFEILNLFAVDYVAKTHSYY